MTGDSVTQLAPWRRKPPGTAQSGRDLISAQSGNKISTKNPRAKPAKDAEQLEKVQRRPTRPIQRGEDGLAGERRESRETAAQQTQPSWEENLLL